MDLAALKAELTADPLSRGYAAMGDEAAAVSLNTHNRLANRASIESGEIIASIVRAEYDALSTAGKDYLRLVALARTLPLTDSVKSELAGLFGVGTQTRANFIALQKQTGSRADELGLGYVTASDVADARRL